MAPRTSIIIVTYNSSRYISELFKSLMAVNYPREDLQIIFIDNNSIDETFEKILKMIKDTKISNIFALKLNKNIGLPAALEIGIKYSLKTFNPKYIVIMNPDIRIIDFDFMKKIIRYMEMDDRICLVSPALSDYDSRKIQHTVGLIDITGTAYLALYSAPMSMLNLSRCKMFPAPWVTFALAVINRKCLEDVGMPRRDFFLYYEDVEFSLRALSKGYLVLSMFLPVAAHREGGSLKDEKLERIIRAFFVRNSLIVTFDYLGFLPFIARTLLYIFRAILERQQYYPGATLNGILNALKYIIRNNKNIRISPSIPSMFILTKNNIIVLLLKYKRLDIALRVFSMKGFIEYLQKLKNCPGRAK